MMFRWSVYLRLGGCLTFVSLTFSDFYYLFIGKWASKLDKCRSCSPSWPDTWWKWSGGCENNWSLLCMPGRRNAMIFCIALMFPWPFFYSHMQEPRDGRLLLRIQKALLARPLWLSCCNKLSSCLWERFITILHVYICKTVSLNSSVNLCRLWHC